MLGLDSNSRSSGTQYTCIIDIKTKTFPLIHFAVSYSEELEETNSVLHSRLHFWHFLCKLFFRNTRLVFYILNANECTMVFMKCITILFCLRWCVVYLPCILGLSCHVRALCYIMYLFPYDEFLPLLIRIYGGNKTEFCFLLANHRELSNEKSLETCDLVEGVLTEDSFTTYQKRALQWSEEVGNKIVVWRQ